MSKSLPVSETQLTDDAETVFTRGMTKTCTTTNVWGWSPHGFDPDKNQPSWRQYLIDACEFDVDCAHQGDEGARLATIAELWLEKLRRHPCGFIPAPAADMEDLAAVVADFTDYEETNGREQRLVSQFAQLVLRGIPAVTR